MASKRGGSAGNTKIIWDAPAESPGRSVYLYHTVPIQHRGRLCVAFMCVESVKFLGVQQETKGAFDIFMYIHTVHIVFIRVLKERGMDASTIDEGKVVVIRMRDTWFFGSVQVTTKVEKFLCH